MTHPKARAKRRARSTRADPKPYRLTPLGRARIKLDAPAGALVATCVYCGCTDERACPGGCSWLIVNLDSRRGICSSCRDRALGELHTDDEIATQNRRALAQLRTLNNALLAAGLRRPRGAGDK